MESWLAFGVRARPDKSLNKRIVHKTGERTG
jgi:hypothetical protein